MRIQGTWTMTSCSSKIIMMLLKNSLAEGAMGKSWFSGTVSVEAATRPSGGYYCRLRLGVVQEAHHSLQVLCGRCQQKLLRY
jgi:hypothetical protein